MASTLYQNILHQLTRTQTNIITGYTSLNKDLLSEIQAYMHMTEIKFVLSNIQIDSASTNVDSERIMDLRQFCKLYRDITKQLRHMHGEEDEDWQKIDPIGEEV